MIKELVSWSLILFGIIEIGNFFAHHGTSIPVSDYSSHALIGLILCVAGVFLLKVNLSFDSWSKIK
jgi:hypothetical protein